ncbi:hypothetical protein F383_02780 [Gossypium arboreum]|uniref:Uncharacterized protein n=1 Tax=Gossypium arboreum TaxID=29729 RepID=A0A0B0PUT5_GOSAR|nr:hypothetical protein F383_02780 [Gossypium arboreum]
MCWLMMILDTFPIRP